VSGGTWDDFVARRIFEPLGMTSASTTVRGLDRLPDLATPHALIDGRVEPVAYRNIDNAGPAGSINADVVDIAKWIRFQIDSGRVGDRRILSQQQAAEAWSGRAIIRSPMFRELFGRPDFLEYGLGWFLFPFHGHKVVLHGGNIDGMSALVSFIPDQRIGVVVLTNMNQSFMHVGVTYWIYDRLLGEPAHDWNTEILAKVQAAEKAGEAAARADEAARVTGTSPSRSLAEYAGTYADSLYGSITIRNEGGGLAIDIDPGYRGELEHWNYDTFVARWNDKILDDRRSYVTFFLDATGKVASVKVDGFTTFRRVATARAP